MNARNGGALLIGLAVALGFPEAPASSLMAGQQTIVVQDTQQETQQDKEKATSEKKAVLLLDQLVGEAGALKLPENRAYIQISAADMLWERDEARARALFLDASSVIADLMRRTDRNDRRGANADRVALQLRQELVMTAARRDSTLAYQLLQAMPAPAGGAPGSARPGGQASLEQSLVAVIAANDPKTAIKNAQGWLDKGEYPITFQRVLSELQQKDGEAASKLSEQLVKRLQPEEILAKQDAAWLSLSLLRAGPRPEKKSTGAAVPPAPANSQQVLTEQAFRDLMSAAITAALKATPPAAGAANRAPSDFRGRPNGRGGPAAPQTEADIAQSNARSLLSGLQNMLQRVDQYLPERGLALRQKVAQMGMDDTGRAGMNQIMALMQQGTTDSLMNAAAAAPEGMRAAIYRQAAMKALDEGNADRAREIANQHFDGTTREGMLRTIEMRVVARSASGSKMDEIRQTLARAQTDDERVSLLLQFAGVIQAENPKAALQLLDEARLLVTRRAASYSQLDAQLNVAHALAQLDTSRSFDTMEPGINQINELLSAAAVLNGFEVNIFRDGEMPLQGGGSLTGILTRYGRELAALAKTDFERAQTMADKFLLAEPRILIKLAIVRGVLGGNAIESGNRGFGFNTGGGQFGRRPQ